ncbi:MAG: long-chain fatty acid--CoA ligase [Pseudomonadota bacterium]|nr:long-chain fatty acid--CoA ligase [Pseudomonadota bacterium]
MSHDKKLHAAISNLSDSVSSYIDGKNLLSVFEDNVKNHPDKIALHQADDESYQSWHTITWQSYLDNAFNVATGLSELMVSKNDIVLILSRNRAEHNIIDMGILYANAIPCSLYQTLKSNQIADILKITQSTTIFCDTNEMAKEVIKANKIEPCIRNIIMLCDPDESMADHVTTWADFLAHAQTKKAEHLPVLQTRKQFTKPTDTACILFTSGTTGHPKGVVLTHENILWTVHSYLDVTDIVKPEPSMVSYLPMAHITERVAHHYHIICRLGSLHFAFEMTDLKAILPIARPSLFFAVPRVWEKFYNGLRIKIRDSGKEELVMSAIANGLERVACIQTGRAIPWLVSIKHFLFTHLIFNKMLSTIGLDKTEIFGSGAAPMNAEVQKFFHAINIPITEVYGLTENTAPALSCLPNNPNSTYRALLIKQGVKLPTNTNKIGTVGLPIPGTEVRIEEDGELMLKGPFLFKEYYKNPSATKACLSQDGWFKTGDLASIDGEGFVSIIGRKKEILVTSGGKNIAPVYIESLLLRNKLLGQVCLVGDRRHFVSALITLNHEGGAETWAKDHNIDDKELPSLAKNPLVYEAVEAIIADANKQLSRVQQIKKFVILKDTWGPDTGELTPTLKLKRFFIEDKYRNEIDDIYKDELEH